MAQFNLQELQESLVWEWKQAFIRNYVLSRRQGCLQVIGARGGHTGY